MNDELLILYYYRDGLSERERQDIAAALDSDPVLAGRYEALVSDLESMREPDDVPAPEGLEYRLQSALQRAIRLEEAERSRPRTGFHRWSFLAGAGVAAVLAAAIGIGLWSGGPVPDGPPAIGDPVAGAPPGSSAVEWSAAAFERGLESHFRSSRARLSGLEKDASPERAALVTAMVEQNRLYSRLAMQNGAPDLARVLRSFEGVLVQLGQEDLSAEESAALQAQLEFEFSVMLTKLARESSQDTQHQNLEMSL